MRIAMWSGPRNLSTAMMYSFGARADFAVWDEPYYGAYLATTGLDHPMRAEILAVTETDTRQVSKLISGSIPGNCPHFYQKHMAHHMLPEFDLSWLGDFINVFLIRHPARVVASYAAKRENPELLDLGFVQQVQVFNRVVALGQKPVVIDSVDIRANPEAAMRHLCEAIGINFDPAMLHWPKGGHPDDGVWASHWYGAVHQSCRFSGSEGPIPVLSGDDAELVDRAMPYYELLSNKKIKLTS